MFLVTYVLSLSEFVNFYLGQQKTVRKETGKRQKQETESEEHIVDESLKRIAKHVPSRQEARQDCTAAEAASTHVLITIDDDSLCAVRAGAAVVLSLSAPYHKERANNDLMSSRRAPAVAIMEFCANESRCR